MSLTVPEFIKKKERKKKKIKTKKQAELMGPNVGVGVEGGE